MRFLFAKLAKQHNYIYDVTDVDLTCFWLADSAILKDDVRWTEP